jgi:hypothetical protein
MSNKKNQNRVNFDIVFPRSVILIVQILCVNTNFSNEVLIDKT